MNGTVVLRDRRPLAVGMSVALCAAGSVACPGEALASTVHVTNCYDSGAGSLRDAVATVSDGGTVVIDGNLLCSTITLTSGAIDVTKNTLYIKGPGKDVVAISGDSNSRVLRHTGNGRLAVYDVTIAQGKYKSDTTPLGGCVYSTSNVALVDATVSGCFAVAAAGNDARGGGVYAHGILSLERSTISGNVAFGVDADTKGGGVYAKGQLIALYSIFSNNEAVSVNSLSRGGAMWTMANTYLLGSLVNGNKAMFAAAIGTETDLGGTWLALINSTVSENVASGRVGGIYAHVPLTIGNSTIAFNEAPDGGAVYAVGVPVTLKSSIIADNVAGGLQNDLDGALAPPPNGYNNLITSSTIGFPPNTLTSCPKLGPLADNGGGPMLTHALLGSSPAIDAGYNPYMKSTDQRGVGFPRVANTKADIGAFERQGGKDDRVFVSGFEPVCDH